MGMQTAQAAQPISQQQPNQPQQLNQPQGKGNFNFQPPQTTNQPTQQFQGKGSTTNAATSGQPQMGQPNSYPNTIQPWDNANIQPKQSSTGGGKGKGY